MDNHLIVEKSTGFSLRQEIGSCKDEKSGLEIGIDLCLQSGNLVFSVDGSYYRTRIDKIVGQVIELHLAGVE